nr:RBBP8 N-terminal-like protein [Oryctolagus cuniculus]XP_051684613.1 RBBP8 N-terminal-like protein [Oryctolagus cuniculus]XP_051684614.1 RBBP8 N-terminal-like protein [Oryctolagus cuniculus]XP_051684615.1 RBBP8 N-terminal-like protein [Oryctolagus cuniculus]XP_051684616.1 RBBP8 N-terminal-like protein [Oryctolagus cuniculus]
MESFAEALNRLKDAHEKEVLGLQSKLAELNTERCRDAQRIEELFAKNQQLREQQRTLKENLRVLENRLRAGLCDRCMVTQELARKKQLELESSHLQGLQHLFLLTNEMKALKEENEALREAVRRLRLADRPKPLPREASSDPPSPTGWKAGPERPPAFHQEAEEDPPGTDTHGEGKPPAVCGTSPGAKVSPGTNLPEPRAPDVSPQCIANQLHGTIATVRPGARACPMDHGSADGTPPPLPTRSSPPSPACEHSLPLHSFLRAPSASAIESLKRCLKSDRLCLLSRHLALHLQGPHGGPLAPATAPGSSQPQGLTAVEAESWEEPTGLLGLPSTLAGIQDPRLEGALHLLLAQQQLRARVGSARLRATPMPGETLPSPPLGLDAKGPESEGAGAALPTSALARGRQPQPRGPGSPGKETTQDCAPDKPLDLSDRGRNGLKLAVWPESLGPAGTRALSPEPPQGAEPPALTHSPGALGSDTKETGAPESEEPPTPVAPRWPFPSPGGTAEEAGARPKPAAHLQGPGSGGHPELSKAGTQRPETDELDEPDPSDSELSAKAEAEPSTPGAGPRCTQEQRQKRKPASELGGKASKKLSRGRRKPRGPPAAADAPASPRDAEDHSPCPSDWEET